jgi:hypothetical protein
MVIRCNVDLVKTNCGSSMQLFYFLSNNQKARHIWISKYICINIYLSIYLSWKTSANDFGVSSLSHNCCIKERQIFEALALIDLVNIEARKFVDFHPLSID